MLRPRGMLVLLLFTAATSAATSAAELLSQAETLLLQVNKPTASRNAIALSSSDPAAVVQEIQSLRAEIRSMQDLLAETMDSFTHNSCTNSSDVSVITTTTTTTTTIVYRPNLCAVFGDPHFITFDGAQTTWVGEMVLWIVKSKDVWLQGISHGSQGCFLGMAVGGPFMMGHSLVVYNATETGMTVLFDGHRVLNESISEFHVEGLLEAYRAEEWDPSVFNDRVLSLRTRAYFDVGDFPSRFTNKPRGGLVLLRLPKHIEVTLSGVDYMSAVVAMEAEAGGQGGFCGNFNGDPDDDAKPIVPSWDWPIGPDLDPVPEEHNLFKQNGAMALLGLDASFGRQPDLGNDHVQMKQALLKEVQALDLCEGQLMEQAQAKCAPVTNKAFHKACIFDICITGRIEAADDMLQAEILEEGLNARGYPQFVGHGQCLDSEGREFRKFKTNLRTDQACQDVLRQLATTKGVLGAQLRRGSACEVLVEKDSDPTGIMIPEGWSEEGPVPSEAGVEGSARATAASLMVGEGLVSKATEDASWNCWQLV